MTRIQKSCRINRIKSPGFCFVFLTSYTEWANGTSWSPKYFFYMIKADFANKSSCIISTNFPLFFPDCTTPSNQRGNWKANVDTICAAATERVSDDPPATPPPGSCPRAPLPQLGEPTESDLVLVMCASCHSSHASFLKFLKSSADEHRRAIRPTSHNPAGH